MTKISPREKDLGGFSVRRILPFRKRQSVGPFIFFDHMGPAEFAPGQGIDVRPHPHINLATVTYLFDGSLHHKDSLGSDQEIHPGDVNWMTAGKGIVHSERSSDESRKTRSTIEGIQSWVALPVEHEETEPRFDHYPHSRLPQLEHQGNRVVVIAGRLFGEESPVKVFSPTLYAEFKREREGSFDLSIGQKQEAAIYLVKGALELGGESVSAGEMLILGEVDQIRIHSGGAAHFLLIGGEALPEPRHIWWNFVSSREERIEQAKEDWKNKRFDRVEGDSEFIPLPEV